VLDNEENRGIEPLPNLEFKFVAANTLIGLPEAASQSAFGVTETIDKLKTLREAYLRSFGAEKSEIETEFRATQQKLFKENVRWAVADTLVKHLTEWDPFSYESCGWFDPGWMFGLGDGFDIVIANPPYDVLNVTEGQRIPTKALETIRSMPMYKIALGGKLNFFRLFIARAFTLMSGSGILTYIIPYAFMCDSSSKALREFVLTEKQFKFLEAFPERDDPNKRLFKAVKMSTCIVCIRNTKEDALFPVRTHYSREISFGVPTVHVNNSTIISIDPENLSIPLMSDTDLAIVKHLLQNAPTRLGDFGKCYEGEINLTFHKKFLSSKDSLAPMIKGAAIQRYQILEEMSQGEIQYLNSKAFLKHNTSLKSTHHKFRRIVMQGITGVNEAVRLKMTIIDSGIFCGNSANYILVDDSSWQQEYLLALLNSRLLNWFFRLFSTNSNVNGYQVDNLPIAKPGTHGSKIVAKVDEILSITKDTNYHMNTTKQARVRELDSQIDQIVYELYGLTPEEISVVEDSIR
jgi:Alw26I/Eco31I/Esp3I family type II restriction m6 adenine DNA methyltransferase